MPDAVLSLLFPSSARQSSSAFPESESRAVIRFVPFLVALTVLTWIGATAVSGQGQWGDHFEQFVWAHGVEWGYQGSTQKTEKIVR